MKNKIFLAAILFALPLMADVRVRVRLGAGHPIHRTNRMVVVRPPRPTLRPMRQSIVYAPPIVWNRTVVSLPGRDRLSREDSETINRRENWVDSTLDVNGRGNALFLNVDGRAHIDFAEVTFENGQVQVVDFREGRVESGTFQRGSCKIPVTGSLTVAALKACVDSIHFPSRERGRAVTERAAKPDFARASNYWISATAVTWTRSG